MLAIIRAVYYHLIVSITNGTLLLSTIGGKRDK